MSGLTPDTQAMVDRLLAYARRQGYGARVASERRTCGEQDALYAKGRTTSGGIVTGAPGCRSWHTWGRAVDIYIPGWPDEAYRKLGAYWQSIGGRWGGDFGDPGHFEWHPGVDISDVCPSGTDCNRAVEAGIPMGTNYAAVTATLTAAAIVGSFYAWKALRR